MFYLILKFTVLFALAALFGFLFGRWWARRSFVDVTHDYMAMSRAAQAPWDKIWKRFDAVEASVSEVRRDLPTGLEVLQGNLSNPVKQGFSAVRGTLDDLDTYLRTLPAPAASVDFAPLEQRLGALEQAVHEMPRSGEVDFSALQAHISTLSAAFAERASVDFTPVELRLSEIERSLDSLRVPDLNRWLDVVEKALHSNREVASLAPLETRLERIEQSIASLSGPVAAPQPAARISTPGRPTVAPRPVADLQSRAGNNSANLLLLESPQYGSKDDLKHISGIGPKLERELNRHGVYYFWQVADWQASDIAAMDERLEAFRGRIERDGWVSQARRLMNDGDAAARPGEG